MYKFGDAQRYGLLSLSCLCNDVIRNLRTSRWTVREKKQATILYAKLLLIYICINIVLISIISVSWGGNFLRLMHETPFTKQRFTQECGMDKRLQQLLIASFYMWCNYIALPYILQLFSYTYVNVWMCADTSSFMWIKLVTHVLHSISIRCL